MDFFEAMSDNRKLLIPNSILSRLLGSLRLAGVNFILDKTVSTEEHSSRSMKFPQMKHMHRFTSIY